MDAKSVVKVRILKGFSLHRQGWYREGDEVTLYFERNQTIGVLKPERYQKLLERGNIELIDPPDGGQKEEVSDG